MTPPALTDTRVVLVDARPERRAVLRTILEHADVSAVVLGEAANEVEALHEVERHAADLVIIDLPAPAEDGLAAVAALRARFPALVVVVCSFSPADAMRPRALDAGADAYLLKPVSARELMAAMREVPVRVGQVEATAALAGTSGSAPRLA